jgi:hypothetical protein
MMKSLKSKIRWIVPALIMFGTLFYFTGPLLADGTYYYKVQAFKGGVTADSSFVMATIGGSVPLTFIEPKN